jgi:flagellar FliJ protein
MKQFKFRLATLVRLRESVRDERRGQLADALRVQTALEDQVTGLEQQLGEIRRSQASPAGPVDVDRLLAAQRYEVVLQFETRKLRGQLATLAVEVEKRRQALMIADQDVKVLEKLRERQLDRYRADAGQALMKEMDEIAGRQAVRASLLDA